MTVETMDERPTNSDWLKPRFKFIVCNGLTFSYSRQTMDDFEVCWKQVAWS